MTAFGLVLATERVAASNLGRPGFRAFRALAAGVEMLGLIEEQGQSDPPRHWPFRIAGSSSLGFAVFLTGSGLAADIARTFKR
jgi:hypothetical protein